MPSSRPGRPALVLLSAAALLATPLAVLGGTPASAGAPPAAAAEPQDVASSGPLRLQNSFVSDVGWVKPGEAYPSRLLVTNTGSTPLTGVQVTASAPAGTDFVSASGAAVTPSSLTWSVGTLAAGATRTLVVHAEADTPAEDPRVVWKNIASNATASATGVAPTAPARSHGPKVIPATAGHDYDSARFGDRPFPVVPVEYADRKFNGGTQANPLPTGGAGPNTAEALAKAINDPANPGSTFNLYQEMSYGQLFPKGTVPALGKTEAYSSGKPVKTFTTPAPAGLCTGVTTGPLPPQGMRVVDGKYQLPGTTGYYGSDKYAKGYTAQAGVPLPVDDIDGGCGPTAKLVYDAAVIADPDIDYSDYDTDKDGVVDFFMAVFAGCGGNGGSQLAAIACPDSLSGSYDNVWPHSSSLEDTYTDAATGLRGYVSQDQLKDLEGRPLWYADAGRSTTTPVPGPDSLKVFVRVGPYNVNPETAIDKASVISHEYGHSLGLPDFYSTSSRETYGDWNLMATDKSQFMDVYSRQRLGWVVPDVIGKGSDVEVTVRDGKEDVQRIDWVQPDGAPYSLSPANGDQGIHNGQAFVAKLPGRPLLDEKVLTPAQGSRLWFSGAGNDFGCSPLKGHNLDIALPGAERLPAGSKITATFDSAWNIEWDYDYGFVLAGARPGGKQTLVSQPSDKNYTTPKALNPNNNGCLAALDNGLTGSSASYAKDPVQAQLDRVNAALPPAQFVQDSYTLDELAGQPGAFLRFSYATDPGFAGQGWFIDNLKVVATPPSGPAVTLFDNGFEDPATGGPEGAQVWNGSCKDSLRLSDVCTAGWNHVSRGGLNTLDHAYYLEMRDRSGFDFEGRGEDDRDPIGFQPGLSLVYADEAHGDGNAGTDDPPAQHPLDAVPQPGEEAPTLDDAAFTAEAARSRFTDTPDPVTGRGRYDNYTDPTRPKDKTDTALSPWEFDYSCLT
ncbi:MAG: domain containing protein, partial [Frankiales bacterium]|nr:domain containing protein [Frankiales bacterium]